MNKSNPKVVGRIHLIETFGAFDGPGIRYVVFLQGCPFQCKYCHNRDTWSTKGGSEMTVKDILKDYELYKSFYREGGLTVSGGEPLFQLDFVRELFKEAKKKKIHTALDTSSGLFSLKTKDKYLEILKYTDLVMLDIKEMIPEKHKWLTGLDLEHVLEFAKFVDSLNIKMWIRHVLIPEINLDVNELKLLRNFLEKLNNVCKIEILPYHTKGIMKWEQMGLKYPLMGIREANKNDVKIAEDILLKGYKFRKDEN